MKGQWISLEPITDGRHFDDLWHTYSADKSGSIWHYLPYGPFENKDDFLAFATATYLGEDPMFHALVELQSGKALGVASLMRINQAHGVIETGHICYGPAVQRTAMTTEVIYLFGKRIFDQLGYRRFEWKCDAANKASRRAADRFGFKFEGIFRQALVVKQRNRDTAWYSIIDSEWPQLKAGFEAWLAPDNFDHAGNQINQLEQLRG